MQPRCGSGTSTSITRASPMVCWAVGTFTTTSEAASRAFEFVAVSKGVNLEDFPEPEAALAVKVMLRGGFIIRYDLPREQRD